MKKKKLFLICNAHIDPVWLWQWEEGLAETLTTFRTAAKLCEEFDDFIFCHNEALLYKWIEIYEPALFNRIKALVSNGKWHIMGGWYLQPDCNMPSGESFVRQILAGKLYFKRNFNVEPTVAINFDPFGHSRGLVQILKKSGYSSYLFYRPDKRTMQSLQGGFEWMDYRNFKWKGFDGSEILSHHVDENYNSRIGQAVAKIKRWMSRQIDEDLGIVLWGIGNHGGGPSRIDISEINEFKKNENDWEICHSTPEEFFSNMKGKNDIPTFSGSLNPFAVGCYTSMAQVKQRHRQLENAYYFTEKMVTNAYLQNLMDYPQFELQQALEDLLFCEFHDILPGSGIPEVEIQAIRKMEHALEILDQVKSRAFFQLLSGEEPASDGEFPIYVYNPHPYDIDDIIECEFQAADPNNDTNKISLPEIRNSDNEILPVQVEKESSNIQVDLRKRIVFNGILKAASMNRFSCYLKPQALVFTQDINTMSSESIKLASDICEVKINMNTGFIDGYCANGIDYLDMNALQLLVIKDYPDPWGMKVRAFRNVEGVFSLMTEDEAAVFAGVDVRKLSPIRIIEDGAIRTVVEVLLKYNNSAACVWYKIPKSGSEFEVDLRVFWFEKDKMLKLSVPSCFTGGSCRGQVAYGVENFQRHGEELVAQKWISVLSEDNEHALTIINSGTYGFDFADGELRISLLRSAAYAGHPINNHVPIVKQDRFETRIDQGERLFKFWINAGKSKERILNIEREALVKSESPVALCCYPVGEGKKNLPGVTLSNSGIQLTALKIAEEENWLVLRLFEPTGESQNTRINIPVLDSSFEVNLKPFEIKSFAVDLNTKSIFEIDLLERKMHNN